MTPSRSVAPKSGPSIPPWAWFSVASLIAVSLVGILAVLLLKGETTSNTAEVGGEGATLVEQHDESANQSTIDATAGSPSGVSALANASLAQPESISRTQGVLGTDETDGAPEAEASSPNSKLTASDIVSNSSKGVVLISTFSNEDQKVGVGSGFLIDQSGLIATNFHVLRGCSRAEVEFRSGESIPVKGMRAYDESADLAILEIERTPRESSALELADHTERTNASAVISVGHPEQFKFTTTTGILSAVHRTADLPMQLRQAIFAPAENTWLQTTAVIAGGSSGGPLFNGQGEVIGINTWQSKSFSFAADVRHLRELIKDVGEEAEPIARVTGPDQEFQLILSEYQNKLRYFNYESRDANTQEAREAVIARDPTPDYADRFLTLAEQNSETPICFRSLSYACRLSLQALEPTRCESQLLKATNLLIERYRNDPRLAQMLWGFRGESSKTIDSFLEDLANASDVHDIKGIAQFALGVNHYSSDTDEGAELAIAALERVRSEFPDVIYFCSDPRHPEHSLASEAGRYLYELRTLRIGRAAPTIHGKDQHDSQFSLDQMKGKVVVLDFWAAWCSPCIRSLPDQKKLVEKYEDQPVELVGVFCGDPAKLSPLLESGQVTWRNWMDGPDGEIGHTYRISAFPTIYVIDQEGRIRFRQSGVVPPSELHQVIDGLLKKPQD